MLCNMNCKTYCALDTPETCRRTPSQGAFENCLLRRPIPSELRGTLDAYRGTFGSGNYKEHRSGKIGVVSSGF
eukprot:14966835-Alexandrium_andersonii.AAC.1